MFGARADDVKRKPQGGGVAATLRAAIDTLYPPRCLLCEERVDRPGTLCATCWRDTPFIDGLTCDKCGVPVHGEAEDAPVHCDDCMKIARPWDRGRAALVYGEGARKLVLGLKYADRHDIAAAAGPWLARTAAPLIRPDTLIAPVPLHRKRLFVRRYNQSAFLARAASKAMGVPHCPDLLVRTRATTIQDGRSKDGRFENLQGAIRATPRHIRKIEGRHILLVDDVMTSGATFSACAEACFAAGADEVDVVSLARVTRDE